MNEGERCRLRSARRSATRRDADAGRTERAAEENGGKRGLGGCWRVEIRTREVRPVNYFLLNLSFRRRKPDDRRGGGGKYRAVRALARCDDARTGTDGVRLSDSRSRTRNARRRRVVVPHDAVANGSLLLELRIEHCATSARAAAWARGWHG